VLTGEALKEANGRSKEMPRIALNARTLSDLELLAVGAFSPLEGFMGKKDYKGVVHEMRLTSGVPWTLPITLAVSVDEARELQEGKEIAIIDSEEELDITPLFFTEAFYCRQCDAVASAKTCPHDSSNHVVLSGTRVREMLGRGDSLPAEFTRPEVAEVLGEWSKGG